MSTTPTFQHSIVLFCGDDGIPLEFNVRNTNDKVRLRAMIEHGGGLCTQSESAVHLISPGTKVLNADLGKKLVSSRYILDCVKDNYLLDVNDYVFIISEAETSDISEDESEQTTSKKPFHVNFAPFKESLNCAEEEDPIDLTKENDDNENLDKNRKESDLDFTLQIISPETMKELNRSATSSESFIESSLKASFNPKSFLTDHKNEPLTSTAKEPNAVDITDNHEFDGISPIRESQSIVNPEVNAFSKKDELAYKSPAKKKLENDDLPVETAVSSSQEAMGGLDKFDNLLLHKIQQKPEEELHLDSEEHLSQSYTVSSSGDPPMSSKPSSESQAFEILEGVEAAFPAPDSLCSNLHQDRCAYIKKLECEVEKILQKPSPKSLQDKICLVKYICCVEKRSPSSVLASLPTL